VEPSGTLLARRQAGTDVLSLSPPENAAKTQPRSLLAWPRCCSSAPIRVPPGPSRLCCSLLFFPNLRSLIELLGCNQEQRRPCRGGAGTLPAATGASTCSTCNGTETRRLSFFFFFFLAFHIFYSKLPQLMVLFSSLHNCYK